MANKKNKQNRRQQLRKQAKQKRRQSRVENRLRPIPSIPNDFPLDSPFSLEERDRIGNIFRVMESSAGWSTEPEFESMYISPAELAVTFVAIAEEQGLALEVPEEADLDEDAEVRAEIMADLVTQYLDPATQEEFVQRLQALVQRWKGSGRNLKQMEKVVDGEMLLSWLGFATSGMNADDPSLTAWLTVGLVQAIFTRSLDAGMALMGAMFDAKMDDNMADPANLAAAMAQYPGLENYMNETHKKIIDRGNHAMVGGELYLQIFSEEELAQAAQRIGPLFATQLASEKAEKIWTAASELLTKWLDRARFDQIALALPDDVDNDLNDALDDDLKLYIGYLRTAVSVGSVEERFDQSFDCLFWILLGQLNSSEEEVDLMDNEDDIKNKAGMNS